MNPQEQFCHNQQCWAYGRKGEGHIQIHSQQEKRYKCERCKDTFSATKGTALYRAHKPPDEVETVVTLLAHGCPLQAIVAAFGWDERTVKRYQQQAGAQAQRVHEHLVESGEVELGQVQADELRVRVVGGVVWLATGLHPCDRTVGKVNFSPGSVRITATEGEGTDARQDIQPGVQARRSAPDSSRD